MVNYLNGRVSVESVDLFWLELGGYEGMTSYSRQEFTEIRDAIDKALNTSAEELEAAG